MTNLFLRLAGLAALLGVACCTAGFIQGGRPTNLRFEKQNDHLTVEYYDAVTTPMIDPEAPQIVPSDPTPVDTAPADTPTTSAESVTAQADAGQQGWATATPASTPAGLDMEVSGGSVTLQAGDSWQLAVLGSTEFTTKMDQGTWEIEAHRLPAGQDIRFVITYPTGTQLQELDLAIGAGELTADGISCRSADLSVGAGRMTLTNLAVSGECDIEVGMGILDLAGSLARGTDIECGMGIVRCTLARPTEYGYSIEDAVGTVKIDGQHYSGLANEAVQGNPLAAVQFDIECGMGTVEVQFA